MAKQGNIEDIVGSTDVSGTDNPTYRPSVLGRVGKAVMNGSLVALMGASYFLNACSPPPVSAKTSTFTPTSTSTPVATATNTPEPTATYTTTPAPLVLSNFDAKMEGVGEHGNMTCINYQGNKQDLEGLTIKADISQGDKVWDSNAPLESINGKDCFEMMDSKYNVGEPVSLKIISKSENKAIEKGDIKLDIGNFKYYPFIQPLFYRSEAGSGNFVDHNHTENGFYAHDYWFGEGISGIPVHMPFSFKIIRIMERDGSGFETYPNNLNIKYNWNSYLYSTYTGFICVFQHQQPGELLKKIVGNQSMNQYGSGWPPSGETVNYDPNAVLFTFGPKDKRSSLPHLHIGCQIPNLNPSFESSFGFDDNSYGLCKSGSSTPCDGNPNIEIKDLFISSPIDENK